MRKNRYSRTAKQVAQTVLYLAQDPRTSTVLPAGASEQTELLLGAVGLFKPYHLRILRSPRYRRFVGKMENIAPGQILNIGVRKRFIDQETRDALEAGTRQVLVVGAGFDTLGLRLAAEYPDVTFLEIDHPATQDVKRTGLAEIGKPTNLHLVAADLGEIPLAQVLRESDLWRPDAPGVVIAEGLLMYLEPTAVEGFFDAVREIAAPDSLLLFTRMRRDENGDIFLGRGGRFSRFMMRLMGEPLRWGTRDGELDEMLRGRGYRPFSAERLDLRRHILVPAGLGDEALSVIEFPAGAVVG